MGNTRPDATLVLRPAHRRQQKQGHGVSESPHFRLATPSPSPTSRPPETPRVVPVRDQLRGEISAYPLDKRAAISALAAPAPRGRPITLPLVTASLTAALDRADRRTRPLPVDEHGAVIEPIDPRDQLAARDLLDHAAAVIQHAGLTSRQLEIISLQAWGLTYEQISARTGNSRRTVDRELVRARAKLAEALRTTGP